MIKISCLIMIKLKYTSMKETMKPVKAPAHMSSLDVIFEGLYAIELIDNLHSKELS